MARPSDREQELRARRFVRALASSRSFAVACRESGVDELRALRLLDDDAAIRAVALSVLLDERVAA